MLAGADHLGRRQADLLTADRLGPQIARILRDCERALATGGPVVAALPATDGEALQARWQPGPEPGVPKRWRSLPVPLAGEGGPRSALVAVDGGTVQGFTAPLPRDGDLETGLAALSTALARELRPARLMFELSDGSWLELSSPRYWRARATPVEIGLTVAALMGAALALALWSAGLLARPVERLAEAVARSSDPLKPEPLPRQGPQEVAALADTMHQTRVALCDMLEGRTRLLAAISHDLRSPVTRLRLRTEFIDDEALRAKFLSDLDDMQEMITSILDFLVEDVMREEVEVVSFSSLLQSLCDDYADMGMPVDFAAPAPLEFETVRTVFGGAGGRVSFEQYRPLLLRGRPRSLRRAFANLIENAVKYGVWAAVSVHADSHEVVVEIVDDGPGIPEDRMADVMKPFVRLEPSRNRQTGGSGLGLAIVKSIIDAHQGRIEMSNCLRGGLRVRVTLPRLL
ncbi:two-component sensor histidine kinase [Azospirillum thermophilum]|uniref:histidine kinase n=2 Tax=Azospirillum thermophilum TaxID=2202148 RepID=A0A2S2CW87_9PROT|nr:two-component sensor histidine kinase [Azospirillum thermophilum]